MHFYQFSVSVFCFVTALDVSGFAQDCQTGNVADGCQRLTTEPVRGNVSLENSVSQFK